MPQATASDEYRPLYIIEVYLDSGLYAWSTRDVYIGTWSGNTPTEITDDQA